MFESAEVGHKLDKASYERQEPRLREALLLAQYKLARRSDTSVLIVIGGVDGAGKGETVNLLNEWMDPRHIRTMAFGDESDEELQRPEMWRYWRDLPSKGRIGIMFGSWYTQPIVDRAEGRIKNDELQHALDRIARFENMLSREGTLILKFWFHLSRPAQKKRLRELEKNPLTRWRVTGLDWERFKMYGRFRKVSENVLRETSTANAPWIVVEGVDERYRSITVGNVLLQAMQKHFAALPAARQASRAATERAARIRLRAAPLQPALDNLKLIRDLDLSQKLVKPKYETLLEKYQGELNLRCRGRKFKQRSLVLVFEGADAAGKGGAIRRVTGALDARQYLVVPVAAPTEEERAQPYLWRFWRNVPRLGRVAIFDRSWYGRVLVERVEHYCTEADWLRAYAEINDFEEQLVERGAIVCKFWLQISRKMQLRRFNEREKTPFKRFKITKDDWRNRRKWGDYEAAVADMVDRTSSDIAPWTLVEAEDKYFARIKVLKTIASRLKAEL